MSVDSPKTANMRIYLKSKIHNATVTTACLKYVGSITIDEALMQHANIAEYEKVLVVDNTNGNRLETYVIKGKKNSGQICMNGAAAHLIKKGDEIIIMTFQISAKAPKPKIVIVDKQNKFVRFTKKEWNKIKSSGC
jgi:aspartate 1-decarboxylase